MDSTERRRNWYWWQWITVLYESDFPKQIRHDYKLTSMKILWNFGWEFLLKDLDKTVSGGLRDGKSVVEEWMMKQNLSHDGSMGLVYLPIHEWLILMVNAGKYTIHWILYMGMTYFMMFLPFSLSIWMIESADICHPGQAASTLETFFDS